MQVSIKTSLGETVSFVDGKIFCKGVEQSAIHPVGDLPNFKGDEDARKKHEDRVRSSLVAAILEQVASISFAGDFDQCLQTAKELSILQQTVIKIRETSFSEVSNPGYVRKKMNIVKETFRSKLAEINNRTDFTPEQKEQLIFLKLGKTVAKNLKKTKTNNGKAHAIKAAHKIINQASYRLDRLSDKAITARAHKQGVADIDLPYVFITIKTAKEELLKNRTEKHNTKKLVVKENKEASTVRVEALQTAGGLIKAGIENNPFNDLAAIRAKVIDTRDINLHIKTMVYLGNKDKSDYITLELINAFPEWFDRSDIDALKNPLADIELTDNTFYALFTQEDAISYPCVLNYCIRNYSLNWLSAISSNHAINKGTVKALAEKYSIIARVISAVKQ